MDEQELELALGRVAVRYSRLMLLVRLAIPALVNSRDFDVGRLVIEGLNDGPVIELWAKLASHHASAERQNAITDMRKQLQDVQQSRNRHLHGLYIPIGSGDPSTPDELRTFPQGRARMSKGKLGISEADMASIRDFEQMCTDARVKFARQFAQYER